MTGSLPLFPLHTVLFPGGLLPLRIFEPRYVDMVGRCLRHGEAFGVVRIEDGSDTESEARTAAVGTSAHIVDFQTLDDGLLGLLCRGDRRFRINARRLQADGLNCADVEWLEEHRGVPVPPQYQPLLPLLRAAMAKLTTMGRFLEPDYADAAWVGHRLAELLPLERAVQQRLLEIDDPETRLALLAPLLEAAPG